MNRLVIILLFVICSSWTQETEFEASPVVEPAAIATIDTSGEVRMSDSLSTSNSSDKSDFGSVANMLFGLNLGYRSTFNQTFQNHGFLHWYFLLFNYENDIIWEEGQFHDWAHYIGLGAGSILQVQYGFLDGPNSWRTKMATPLGKTWLLGGAWDSQDGWSLSLEYNFLTSRLFSDNPESGTEIAQ